MNNIISSLEILHKTITNIENNMEPKKVLPTNLNKTLKLLEEISCEKYTFQVPKNLKELQTQIQEKMLGKKVELLRSDSNNLPFVLFEKGTSEKLFFYILNRELNLNKDIQLKKLLYVYFNNFSDSNYSWAIANKILTHFNKMPNKQYKKQLLKTMHNYRKIFFDKSVFVFMSNYYGKFGFEKALKELGLFDEFSKSKFVLSTLKYFYQHSKVDKAKYSIFEYLEKNQFMGDKNLLYVVVDQLIMLTEEHNCLNWKNRLLTFAYKELGDPRLPLSRVHWNMVSEKAKTIFLRWLANNDLNLFFKIIEETAVDKMWRYRDKFWRAYLNYISNTKVFFGKEAQRIAQGIESDKLLNYGTVLESDRKLSAFIFEIGNYMFCEWSHNGMLCIWEKDNIQENVSFESIYITKSRVRKIACLSEIKHSRADSYSWQKKVAEFLNSYCGIYKDIEDWRL